MSNSSSNFMNINQKILNQLNHNQISAISFIAQIADNHSVKAFLVGGVVRDIFLNHKIHDIDIAVESDPNLMFDSLNQSENFQIISMSEFGVVKGVFDGIEIDIAMTREEAYPVPGSLPNVSLKTEIDLDLIRRDFSINALAVSINSKSWGEVIDVNNSLEDLQNGVIKILHPKSFIDDPTRIFRAIKYSYRLNMDISKFSSEKMYESLNHVNLLSGKRIANEILLIFQEEDFGNILNHKIMSLIFEQLDLHLSKTTKNENFENIKDICREDENMWWVFISFYFNHLDRAKLVSKLDLSSRVNNAIEAFTRIELMNPDSNKSDIYMSLNGISKNVLEISKILLQQKCVIQISIFETIIEHLKVILDGNSILELGVSEGPEIGEILHSLTIEIIEKGPMTVKAQKDFVKSLIP